MTVPQERARLLRDRLEDEGLRDLADAIAVEWRAHGIVLRSLFFILTSIAVIALYLLTDQAGVFTAIVAIAFAEILILRFRWLGTGVEEALWIGGAFALVSELPNGGDAEALLLLAAAAAVAWLRVRNPLFGAASAGFVVAYCETRFDRGVIVAIVIAAISVLALLRTWRRPTAESLWIALAVTMPLAGRFAADAIWRDMTILLYGGFAALTLALALRKRHHGLFAAGGVALVIAGTDLARKIDAPLEAKLAAAGAILLGSSWLVSRALRDRTSGFVLAPMDLDEIDTAATLVSSGAAGSPPAEAPSRPEGGRFGGAGASGDY